MQSICISASEGGTQGEKFQTEEHQQCIYYSMTDAVSDAKFKYSGIQSQQPFQIQWHLNAETETP